MIKRASRSARIWTTSLNRRPPGRARGARVAVRHPPLGVLGPFPRLHQTQEEPAAEVLVHGRQVA